MKRLAVCAWVCLGATLPATAQDPGRPVPARPPSGTTITPTVAEIRWDFENGNLGDWSTTGTSFTVQRGDTLKADQVLKGGQPLVPLGGDYWKGSYPRGQHGNCWVASGPVGYRQNRELLSPEFVLTKRYVHFLIAGGMNGNLTRVELQVRQPPVAPATVNTNTVPLPNNPVPLPGPNTRPQPRDGGPAEWSPAFAATGNNSPVMRREVWDATPLLPVARNGQTPPPMLARIHVFDADLNGNLAVDDFVLTDTDPRPGLIRVSENGRDVFRDASAPVWGLADVHTHLMAHEGFGGVFFHGEAYNPAGMAAALPWCNTTHGVAGISINPEIGHLSGGYPQFDGWPRFDSVVHQQAYIDWIKRAYDGGLRLVVMLAVNNEMLAQKFMNNRYPLDDASAIRRQISAMKAMAAGPAHDWMEVATSPQEARRIIQQNKLAVVLSVEVDSLDRVFAGGGDLPTDPALARRKIQQGLDDLYTQGVRQLTPEHLTNTAFGGCAIYNRLFDALNLSLRGSHYNTDDGWDAGVRYRLDQDPGVAGALGAVARLFAYGPLQSQTGSTWAGKRSHINHEGLNGGLSPQGTGRILLEEMMRRGMLVDLDHFSQKASDEALTILRENDYPPMASHCGIAGVAYTANVPFTEANHSAYGTSLPNKVVHEGMRSASQIDQIHALGGVVGLIIHQGDVRAFGTKVADDCADSCKSWAQAYLYANTLTHGTGLAFGTDVNGLAKLPGPRFGPYADQGNKEDEVRKPSRRAHIDAQRNGVRYSTPIQDYRHYRWDDGDTYSNEEIAIWEAVALGIGGADIDTADLAAPFRVPGSIAWIKDVAKGIRAVSVSSLPEPKLWTVNALGQYNYATVQRGAFYARHGALTGSDANDQGIRDVYDQIRPICRRFEAAQGNNTPLARSTAGRRDFDINFDGMAHYGMMPDFLQDLQNVGLTQDDLAPLFRSAEDYIRMWEKAVRRSQAVGH